MIHALRISPISPSKPGLHLQLKLEPPRHCHNVLFKSRLLITRLLLVVVVLLLLLWWRWRRRWIGDSIGNFSVNVLLVGVIQTVLLVGPGGPL